MTTLRKSDSQLDAEAAANHAIRSSVSEATRYSPMGLMPATLDCGTHPHTVRAYDRHGSMHWTACCLVHEARREWHYAHPDDLHVFRVPSDLETVEVSSHCHRREGHKGDHSPRRLNPALVARVCGAPLLFSDVVDVGELGGPPFALTFVDFLDYPHEAIIRGLREQRRLCASRHSTWPDHRGQVVCGSLLWSVIANGNPLAWAADELELTPERAGELLHTALRVVWSWRSQEANGLKVRESA